MFGLIAYNLLSFVLGPYFLNRKVKRYRTGKHNYEFDFRRMTIPLYNRAKPGAFHMVLVGTGLAEYYLIEQLTLEIKKQHPDIAITWSLAVDTTLDAARKKHPQQSICHKPFDNFFSVICWMLKSKPDMVVSVGDLWPGNMIGISRLSGIKTIVINVRCSDSFPNHGLSNRVWNSIRKWMLRQYHSIGVQDESAAQNLSSLYPGSNNIHVTGPIYLTQDKSSVGNIEEVEGWISQNNRKKLPILALGSSNKIKDEAFVLDAFEIVRSQCPCLLLLAPRNLNRMDEALDLVKKRGLKVSRRSQYSPGKSQTSNGEEPIDVLLLDTLGELFSAYSFTESVFIGGTLDSNGHNVIEPVVWGNSVLFGPGRGKMTPAQEICAKAGVGRVVRSPQELAEYWLLTLTDKGMRETISSNCKFVIEEQHESIRTNIDAIMELTGKSQSS